MSEVEEVEEVEEEVEPAPVKEEIIEKVVEGLVFKKSKHEMFD